jgi:hypothetical protein
MPTQPDRAAEKGTCFVVMGFGKKTDFETGRVLDLNQSYKNLIKPAVEAAGLKCIRADEVVHSGLIDIPMYELLLNADVVIADISTSNRNAIYELGVRHALRPYTTIIIAEEQMLAWKFFDLSHIVIRRYQHLGPDIGVSEAQRFTRELTQALQEMMAKKPLQRGDSPVYKYLANLAPPYVAQSQQHGLLPVASEGNASISSTHAEKPSFGDLLKQANRAEEEAEKTEREALMNSVRETEQKGDWLKAKILLEEIRNTRNMKLAESG